MTGERLRHPLSPREPPIEYYPQRARCIRTYEPPSCHMRLSCSPGESFLIVDADSDSDWVLVTSIRTRHSGYLPKFCIEKEYPDLVEKLSFFHPDGSTEEQRELLKQNGPYSYLLRLCDSLPGLYTFLLYDGSRFLKYKLELVLFWWSVDTLECEMSEKVSTNLPFTAEKSSESPVIPNVPQNNLSEHLSKPVEPSCSEDSNTPNTFQSPNPSRFYETNLKIQYNNIYFDSVEDVVSAIEANYNRLVATPSLRTSMETLPLSVMDGNVPNTICRDSQNKKTIIFVPVRRPPKVTPSADSIYMAMSYSRLPQLPSTIVEVHGELSIWLNSRKKWKPVYAQLDRAQSILTLTEGDKRKPERLDLTKCDYFPIHDKMLDKSHCFGLLLYGVSSSDREEYIFAVEQPSSSTTPSSSSSGLSTSQRGQTSSFSGPTSELDPQAYAGRPFEPGSLSSELSTADRYRQSILPDSFSPFAKISIPFLGGMTSADSLTKVAHSRWVKALSFHCRNIKHNSTINADSERRRSEMRCFRTLEIKLSNAKLLPLSTRRETNAFSVSVDGLEIARAYPGSCSQSIVFEDFPSGFKKIEVTTREDKKKRTVLADLELVELNAALHCLSLNRNRQRNSISCPMDQNTLSSGGQIMPICYTQKINQPQVTITYSELYVLPFQCYDQLRKIISTHLDSELVPVCVYIWKQFLSQNYRGHFVSSLLLATTESKSHLELIVYLLKADITPEAQNILFRGASLGPQILDLYVSIVCSEWRQKCFRRVWEEASRGPSTFLDSSDCCSAGTAPLQLPAPLVYDVKKASTQMGCISNTSATPSCVPSNNNCQSSGHSEWHRSLIYMVIEDLLAHANDFPLQIRWIYAELQQFARQQNSNAVLCNLVFLRGLCPFLCTGIDSTNTTVGNSPTASNISFHESEGIRIVAKSLIALVSQSTSNKTISEGILSTDVFASYRSMLCDQFASAIMSPLSGEELKQLERLYTDEAVRASTRSMSRELAQLASYFQFFLLPELFIFQDTPSFLSRVSESPPEPQPKAPSLRSALHELGRVAYQHLVSNKAPDIPPSSEPPVTQTTPHSQPSAVSASRLRGLGLLQNCLT